MHELFGMKLYYSDALPYVYFIIYLPVVFFVLWLLHKAILKRIPMISARRASVIMFLLILLGLPWWDVYQLSFEAEKLCKEQGGLHIYKTVEAEGFLGGWGIETASKYGFKFIESGSGEHMNRWMMVNGKAVRESITEYKSQYEIQTGADSQRIGDRIRRSSSKVVDIYTREVLGELVTIYIYPSWFDSLFLSFVGAGSTLWLCGREPPPGHDKELSYDDVIIATLKATTVEEGDLE